MFVVICLILVIVLGILSCAISIACDVRAIREQLENGVKTCPTGQTEAPCTEERPKRPARATALFHVHTHEFAAMQSYVVWEWRGGSWHVRLGGGSNPGEPPRFPGAFEGDHVKKWTPEAKP